ncbi:substrate-binding domain-containing protein [Marinobacter caseinilyticus]|uniref:substrate-binding domain-containing protein n=1 Tax=Marinobacter caseinilyticus TaxID=2692195 RepID=UPI0014076FC3|nr:substrate-binding domain-containing protein [Marinobacter caseinilyticus]
MNSRSFLNTLLVVGLIGAIPQTYAKGKVFALVSKSVADQNFIDAFEGCQSEAVQYDDRCVHIGPNFGSHFMEQNRALESALEDPLDGIAISVTKGDYLAQNAVAKARARNIPIVTFDSDFPAGLTQMRSGYVGPDNREIGRRMGAMVKKLGRDRGEFCLMTADENDSNLNERILGIREQLSGSSEVSLSARLNGQNGWVESDKSPWLNGDSTSQALGQVEATLNDASIQVLMSVGAWPIADAGGYQDVLQRTDRQVQSNDTPIIVAATGSMREVDYRMLRNKLVHGLISIDFKAMGRASYHQLKRLNEGRSIAEYKSTSMNELVWFESSAPFNDW